MQVQLKNIKKIIPLLLLIVGCIILLWPAIYNGYPLVYPDTGTYIAAAYLNEIPVDRPIIYSLLVRHISLSHTLWLALFSQALLVTFVIYMLVKKFLSKNTFIISTIIIAIISITTGVSNYTSQIMPDIFCALSIVGFAVLLTTKKMQTKEYILATIVVFSAMSHLSNIIVLLGLLLLTFISMVFRLIDKKIFFRICLISILPIILTLSINKFYSDKYQISKASNVFILARMIEVGVVKDYLRENCTNNNYVLCKNIDNIPDLAYQFLWNSESPLYENECNNKSWAYCWEEKNEAFGKLIKNIIKVPKYRNKLISTYSKDFFLQVIDFNIGILDSQQSGTPTQDWIEYKIENELTAFKNAKQYTTNLKFKTMSKIQLFTVTISLIIILIFCIVLRKIKKEHTIIISVLFLGILGNALTVVLFSTVLDRYQARVIWLIPLIAILLIIQYRIEYKCKTSLQ